MNINELARRGMKGRKKDTRLLEIVVTLTFLFLIIAVLYQASSDKTKETQRYQLYGHWKVGYMSGNEEIYDSLKSESNLSSLGVSIELGDSSKYGKVATYNNELLELGNVSLLEGTLPTNDNEILIEYSVVNLNENRVKLGDTIRLDMGLDVLDRTYYEEILELNSKFKSEGIIPYNLRHRENPTKDINGYSVKVYNDYFYYGPYNSSATPELIREYGFHEYQRITVEKEYKVVGIMNSFSKNWDTGAYTLPNVLLTESEGTKIIDTLQSYELSKMDDYSYAYNLFANSKLDSNEVYQLLKMEYPNVDTFQSSSRGVIYDGFWASLYGADEETLKSTFEQIYIEYGIRINYQGISFDTLGEEVEKSTNNRYIDNFRENTFAYPDISGSEEAYFSKAILGCIFIAATGLIFQIFLTQLKKRSRKFVLFRSVGATTGQIIKLMICEGLHLLKIGLIIGITGGFAATYLIIIVMNYVFKKELAFHISWNLLVIAILAGIIALGIGLIFSMMFSLSTPLTGNMNPPPKHTKINKTKKSSDGKLIFKSFKRLLVENYFYNLSKNMISMAILFVIILIEISSLFLCFHSFKEYNEQVVDKNRPSYQLKAIYGERENKMEEIRSELLDIKGVTSVEGYKKGNNTLLWYDGIEENPYLQEMEKLMPNAQLGNQFGKYNTIHKEQEEKSIRNSYITSIYGIKNASELYGRYVKSITVGNFNKEKFDAGEQVILMIPLHQELTGKIQEDTFSSEYIETNTTSSNRYHKVLKDGNVYDTTYGSEMQSIYERPSQIQPNSKITISMEKEEIIGDSRVIGYRTKEVEVGGIIYYFKEDSIWPHSGDTSAYTVIASYEGLYQLYPNSKYGLLSIDIAQMRGMVKSLYPTKYGETYYNIYTDSKENLSVTEGKILELSNSYGVSFEDYQESSTQLKNRALNISLIIGIFGFSTAFMASIILFNTMVSKMEQEKNNVGIFQSLGITEDQFIKWHGTIGLIHGAISVVVVNVVFLGISLITYSGIIGKISMPIGSYIAYVFSYRLGHYPWMLHVLFCIIIVIQSIICSIIPAKRMIKYSPINNIRSLN